MQNQGGLSIFGKDLTDSIKSSHLTASETDTLNAKHCQNGKFNQIVRGFIKHGCSPIKNMFSENSVLEEIYIAAKFKYDLATNFTPEEIYEKAISR